jgi:hypothetical protein
MTCMGTRTVPFSFFFVLSDSRNGRYPQYTQAERLKWAVRSFCLSFFLEGTKGTEKKHKLANKANHNENFMSLFPKILYQLYG